MVLGYSVVLKSDLTQVAFSSFVCLFIASYAKTTTFPWYLRHRTDFWWMLTNKNTVLDCLPTCYNSTRLGKLSSYLKQEWYSLVPVIWGDTLLFLYLYNMEFRSQYFLISEHGTSFAQQRVLFRSLKVLEHVSSSINFPSGVACKACSFLVCYSFEVRKVRDNHTYES